LHRTLQAIKQAGMKAGVALNPHTPITVLESIITELDLVCLMSVNPGFGGQKFIETTFEKTNQLRQLVAQKNAQVLIEIDGGVTSNNALELKNAGADVLVAGSFVFGAADPTNTIKDLKTLTK